MAILKTKEISKMPKKEIDEKLKELKMELIKNKASKKTKVQTKEIKKAIARLLTFNRLNKSVEK
jgi:ribosomal protein L29